MALATTPLSALLPLVTPSVATCPNPIAVQALRLAAIEMCERTKLWRETLTVTFDEQDEEVPALAYATIHQFEDAEFVDAAGNAHWLEPLPFDMTTIRDRDDTTEGWPHYITQSAPGTITLIPFAAGTVKIQAYMKPLAIPKFGVTGETTEQAIQNVIPTFMAEQYAETLAQGALFRLCSMPGVAWANPQTASQNGALFTMALDRLAFAGTRGQQRAPRRTTSRWV